MAHHSCALCYMELREGDVAKNQNIQSSRGAALYILTFEMILPGGLRRPRPVAGSIGLGRLVNWTQPPSRRVWKTKLYWATRQYHFKSQNVRGRPAGGPYILIFGQVPLPEFHMDCVHRWAINGLSRTNCKSRPFFLVQSRKELSSEQWRPTYSLGFK